MRHLSRPASICFRGANDAFVRGSIVGSCAGFVSSDCAFAAPIMPTWAAAMVMAAAPKKRRRLRSGSSDIVVLSMASLPGLLTAPTRVIHGIQIFKPKRTDGVHLGDVLSGLCSVEVPGVAGQNDDAARRIRLHLVAVELFAKADVENAVDDRVDSVLRVSVTHQLHAKRRLDPDHIGAEL